MTRSEEVRRAIGRDRAYGRSRWVEYEGPEGMLISHLAWDEVRASTDLLMAGCPLGSLQDTIDGVPVELVRADVLDGNAWVVVNCETDRRLISIWRLARAERLAGLLMHYRVLEPGERRLALPEATRAFMDALMCEVRGVRA